MDNQTLDRLLEGMGKHTVEVEAVLVQKARKKAEVQQNNKKNLHKYLPILSAIGLNTILIMSLTLFSYQLIQDVVMRCLIGTGMNFIMNIPVITYLLMKDIKSQKENKRGDVK